MILPYSKPIEDFSLYLGRTEKPELFRVLAEIPI